jgi:hypothetical protein
MAFSDQRHDEIDAVLHRIQEYLAALVAEMEAAEPKPQRRGAQRAPAYWQTVNAVGVVNVLRRQLRDSQEMRHIGEQLRRQLEGGKQ